MFAVVATIGPSPTQMHIHFAHLILVWFLLNREWMIKIDKFNFIKIIDGPILSRSRYQLNQLKA